MIGEFFVKNPEEMEALGVRLSKKLEGKEVICLKGNLGSGKTTFVRGLARGLGIKEGHQVRSPTFTIVNEYPTEKGTLIHIDLYRVRDFEWEEFIGNGVVVVEWLDCGEMCNLCIEIEVLEDDTRRVVIKKL